jgi:nucleolar protein 4
MPKRAGRKNHNNIINKKKVNEIPLGKRKHVIGAEKKAEKNETSQKADAADHMDTDVADVSDRPAADQVRSDVSEGRTIFIRNLSYNTEEEDVADLISRFGEIEYCLICRDKDTGQSRGSAFVKFRDAASADSCVTADKSELVIDGRVLNIDYALERSQIQKQSDEKSRKERDKRNLYLQHEGWIRAGTTAADGVSTTDLQKRAALAEKKKTLLRLLTNFVSKTRLCIHNLPPIMDDKKLNALFQEAGGSGATITECRVMRNRLANGKFTTSKGFGFVQFADHVHALQALRKLNNNPDVFSNAKRPIVEFSIENMFALKKLQRRAEKSAEQADESGKETDGTSNRVKELAKKIGVTPRSVHKSIALGKKKRKPGSREKGKKKKKSVKK